jgi:hypothetical protein
MLETFVQMTFSDGRVASLEGSIYDMDARVEEVMDHFNQRKKDVRHDQTVINSNNGMKLRFIAWFSTSWNVTIEVAPFKRFNTKDVAPFKTFFSGISLKRAHKIVGEYSKLLRD